MELRTAASPRDVKHYTTERLREEFLIDDLFQPDQIKLVYSHIDRIITGYPRATEQEEWEKLGYEDHIMVMNFVHSISVSGVSSVSSTSGKPEKSLSMAKYITLGIKKVCISEWVPKTSLLRVMIHLRLQNST